MERWKQRTKKKLQSLLETLKKNDDNVPKELLQTKYKKPYRELKEQIKELADKISGEKIRQDIVIKNDDAGQALIRQMQAMLEERRKAGAGKELGRTLYREYSVDKFLQAVDEIRIAVWNLWIPYWQQHCCLYAVAENWEEPYPPPKIYNELTDEFMVDEENNIWEKHPEWKREERTIITAGACRFTGRNKGGARQWIDRQTSTDLKQR